MTRATGCVVVLLTAVLAGTERFLYGRRVGRSHATSSAAAPEAAAAGPPSATTPPMRPSAEALANAARAVAEPARPRRSRRPRAKSQEVRDAPPPAPPKTKRHIPKQTRIHGGGPPTRDVAHALDAVRGALPPQSSSSSRRSKRQREPTCKNWVGGTGRFISAGTGRSISAAVASLRHNRSCENCDGGSGTAATCGAATGGLQVCRVRAKLASPTMEWGTDHCRGWPMLERVFGVVARATNITRSCVAGDAARPCGFDVVDCARAGRLGAVRVLLSVSGPARDAATSLRLDDNRVRVTFVPPVAGRVELESVDRTFDVAEWRNRWS